MLVHTEEVMGTVASFQVVLGDISQGQAALALRSACGLLHRADAVFSTYIGESPISRLRRGEADLAEMPEEVHEVLDLCREARRASAGWFDPWAMPGGLDPTGLVKGWAVERALQVVRSSGVPAAMLNAGGDLSTFGEPAPGEGWRIGIRNPFDAHGLACIVTSPGAVATSGTYERGPILLNPFDSRSVTRAASASVTGPSLAMADALATALCVAGQEGLDWFAELSGYEAYLIGHDASEASTAGFGSSERDRPGTASYGHTLPGGLAG